MSKSIGNVIQPSTVIYGSDADTGAGQQQPKKKGKKDKGDDDSMVKFGPTELISRFEEQQERYINDWQNRDETDNYKQESDMRMTKQEVLPILKEQYAANVDEMMNIELQNIALMTASGKKKKKKKGKKKKGKKNKGKTIKLPGYKMIKDLKMEEIL